MRKLSILLGMIIWTILWIGCTAPQARKEEAPIKRSAFSLPGEVLKVEGDVITLRIEKPAPLKAEAKLAVALAQGVIDTCYLLEGKEFLINQTRVKVLRISGNEVQVKATEKTPLAVGSRATIPLEKKIIAVKDFEVVVGGSKDAAKFLQEDVTSLLVDSGHFSIVERAKLGTLLEEIQLGQSGAVDPATAQKAGKLLGAEIILTGTLAASGEQWNVNLRLVNTETGLITGAVHKLGPLHELTADSLRAYNNIDGSFESGDPLALGWRMGRTLEAWTGAGGYQRVYVDTREGANGTKQSLALAFKLGSQRIAEWQDSWISANLRNQTPRGLSGFKGVKFLIKGSDDFTSFFRITSKVQTEQVQNGKVQKVSVNSISGIEFPVAKEWKEIRIPFSSLRSKQRGKGQTQNLSTDLRNVLLIDWVMNEMHVAKGTEGVVWLDEISFY